VREEKSGTCEFLGGDEILAKGLDEVPNHTVVHQAPSVGQAAVGRGERKRKRKE
jgi:hypothetical protein